VARDGEVSATIRFSRDRYSALYERYADQLNTSLLTWTDQGQAFLAIANYWFLADRVTGFPSGRYDSSSAGAAGPSTLPPGSGSG
jgi:hypothetical protein